MLQTLSSLANSSACFSPAKDYAMHVGGAEWVVWNSLKLNTIRTHTHTNTHMSDFSSVEIVTLLNLITWYGKLAPRNGSLQMWVWYGYVTVRLGSLVLSVVSCPVNTETYQTLHDILQLQHTQAIFMSTPVHSLRVEFWFMVSTAQHALLVCISFTMTRQEKSDKARL